MEPPSETKEDPVMLKLQHKTPLSCQVHYDGETQLLSGFDDYKIWYDGAKKKTLATNLVIIDAKRRFATDTSLPQLVAYMGVIRRCRKEQQKQNSIVNGAASDGVDFRFCRIRSSLKTIAARSSHGTFQLRIIATFWEERRQQTRETAMMVLMLYRNGMVGATILVLLAANANV